MPDLMVVRLDAPGEDVIRAAPLLVVEITSPSTSEDLDRKMTASGGRYSQGQHCELNETAKAEQPIRETIDLAELFT